MNSCAPHRTNPLSKRPRGAQESRPCPPLELMSAQGDGPHWLCSEQHLSHSSDTRVQRVPWKRSPQFLKNTKSFPVSLSLLCFHQACFHPGSNFVHLPLSPQLRLNCNPEFSLNSIIKKPQSGIASLHYPPLPAHTHQVMALTIIPNYFTCFLSRNPSYLNLTNAYEMITIHQI